MTTTSHEGIPVEVQEARNRIHAEAAERHRLLSDAVKAFMNGGGLPGETATVVIDETYDVHIHVKPRLSPAKKRD